MKGKRIRTLGQVNDDGVIGSFVRIVVRQLNAQASCLHPHRRIALWVEIGRAPQDFGGNLVLLQSGPVMIERMLSQVAEQLAQRFGAAQAMTINKPLYLLEALAPPKRESVRYSHLTAM